MIMRDQNFEHVSLRAYAQYSFEDQVSVGVCGNCDPQFERSAEKNADKIRGG